MPYTTAVQVIHHVTDFSDATVVQPNDWSVAIICAILLVFSLLIVPYRRKLSLVSRSLFSQRHFSLLSRESKILEEPVYFLTLFGDVLVLAFGLLTILSKSPSSWVHQVSYMGAYGIMVLAILLIYWLKVLIHLIYSKLFEHPREMTLIHSYKFMFVTDAAILMLPFLIIVQFSEFYQILYAYIPLFVILFVLLLYKTLKINPGKINVFQFFIYFCTLEILPYVILLKINSMV